MASAARLTRSFTTDLHVRSSGDGRTIVGRVVPYDVPTTVLDGGRLVTEVFRYGALSRSIAERGDKVRLFVMHDRQRLPIARASSLVESADGVMGEFPVPDTAAGNDVLELVRGGVVDGLSVGFRPVKDRWNRDRSEVERLEVALHEVSVVHDPAYDTARVVGVRAAPSLPVAAARQRLQLAELRFR